ncbi:MAG: winged helix-turn-helix domain-containing protein [Proteobacteria bacterium]|nr:winged helix-turn-helix domain-containing protein [Pseudomonadota bacterium]
MDLLRYQVVGPDGVALALPNRAYDTLLYLIENRGTVVSKDDLMKAVWQKVVVEENNLSQAISALRRALADPRDSPRHIVTIAGRGYRFVADVTVEYDAAGVLDEARATDEATEAPSVAAASSQPPRAEPMAVASHEAPAAGAATRRWILAGLTSIAAAGVGWLLWPGRSDAPPRRPASIAVLPFQPLLENAGNEALEVGMADALITRLSNMPGVVVAPFSSVRRYVDHGQDPLAVGRELKVAAVLESHIQVQSDRIRLTARLLDVGSGKALWAGQFDERSSDFFVVQDALARQVVDALEVELSAAAQQRLRRHDTDNLEAWQLYLQARFAWGTRTQDGFRRAIALYEAALALDPNFALAAAGMADAWAVMAVFNMLPPSAAFPRARAAAERAIALDAQLAEAQAALELAQSIEPMSVAFAANVGLIQYLARDYSAARERLATLVDTAPQYAMARRLLVRVLLMQGEAGKALALLQGHESDRTPGSFSDVGRALALDGQRDAARAEIARVEAFGAQGFGVGYDLAIIWTALGEYEQALAALERGVDDGSQLIGFLNSEPGLDPIRQEPRFRAVSQRLGLG